jgi:hypothetical protein
MLHFILTSSLEGSDPSRRLGLVNGYDDDDLQRSRTHDVEETSRVGLAAHQAAWATLVVRIVLEDSTVLKNLTHCLVRYILGRHLLVTVDGYSDFVRRSLLAKANNDFRRIPM